MKKLLVLSFVAGMVFTACGPSAQEKEAQRIADSIRIEDSIKAALASEQATADSIANANVADTTAVAPATK
jgi:hypothetical protein